MFAITLYNRYKLAKNSRRVPAIRCSNTNSLCLSCSPSLFLRFLTADMNATICCLLFSALFFGTSCEHRESRILSQSDKRKFRCWCLACLVGLCSLCVYQQLLLIRQCVFFLFYDPVLSKFTFGFDFACIHILTTYVGRNLHRGQS